MSAVTFVACLLLGQASASGQANPASQPSASSGPESLSAAASEAAPLTFATARELREAIHNAMKRSAPAANAAPGPAAWELLTLYEALWRDKTFTQEDRLKYKTMLRNRLQALAEKIARSPEVAKQTAAKPAPASVKAPASNPPVLAQQAAGGGAGGAGAGGIGGGGFGGGNPIGQGPPDFGPDLVDLIKRTIAPSTWDDVGGPGTIYYYRPFKVLVIRQTAEVHHQIGGVLGGIR